MAEETDKQSMDTDNKVAVITGASSGIGRATALEFAGKGYDLVLAARRMAELKDTAAECETLGVHAVAVEADTSDEKAVNKLAKKARDSFGHIDVWLNNAGVYLTAKFEDSPVEDMKRVMDVNFFGYVYGSRAALEQFRNQGHGTLINISAVNAGAPQPYVGVYSASKAAVRALDESLRMELRLDNLHKDIHVCTVMPASIDTNLFQNSANYTGQEIQAMEPVYDPEYAARRIVHLADHPRREIIIGPAGKMMEFHSAHTPRLYERMFSRFTHKDLLADKAEAPSSGNLYEPVENNSGTYGGWRQKRLRADRMNLALGATTALVGVASAAYVIARKRRD